MSESAWYAMYDDAGNPPRCSRLSRQPREQQWTAHIDLAIAFAAGRASYRPVTMAKTGEHWWYWPDRQPIGSTNIRRRASGWWLIAPRISRRAMALVTDATAAACRQTGSARQDDIVRLLRHWRRNGRWRLIVARHTSGGLRR